MPIYVEEPCCHLTKALLVGINYTKLDRENQLFGSISDIRCLAKFLEDQGFAHNKIALMDETQTDPALYPTRDNILRMMEWLIADIVPGEALFFGFSGHGTQLQRQGQETQARFMGGVDADGIVAVDEQIITDAELTNFLVSQLPTGARLTAVLDLAYAGTVLELPHTLVPDQRTGYSAAGAPVDRGEVVVFSSYFDHYDGRKFVDPHGTRFGGACINSLLSALSELGPGVTYGTLLRDMEVETRLRDLPHIPMVSSTHPLRYGTPVTLGSKGCKELIRPLPLRCDNDAINPYIDRIDTQVQIRGAMTDGQGTLNTYWGVPVRPFPEEVPPPPPPAPVVPQKPVTVQQPTTVLHVTVRLVSSTRDAGTADTHACRTGVLTSALLSTLYRSENVTWASLMEGMRQVMRCKGSGLLPKLSSATPLHLKERVTLGERAGGSRKALLVAVNYTGSPVQVTSPTHDATNLREYLASRAMFQEFRLLSDSDPVAMPSTKQHIIDGIRWLVRDATKGDNLVFFFSGFGSQQAITGAHDFKNEALVPADYRMSGLIPGETLYKELLLPLPQGVELTMVVDCLQGGSLLELPYAFVGNQSNTSAIEGIPAGASDQLRPNPEFSFSKVLSLTGGHGHR